MVGATGFNTEDLNVLTEFWHRETIRINDDVDSIIKSAQDHAYAVGYRRGREDLKVIRSQRDELLKAVELSLDVFTHHAAPYLHHEVQVHEAHDVCKRMVENYSKKETK